MIHLSDKIKTNGVIFAGYSLFSRCLLMFNTFFFQKGLKRDALSLTEEVAVDLFDDLRQEIFTWTD